MKKKIIKIGGLLAIFIVAVFISSYVMNRENGDWTADMGGATLPRITTLLNEKEVNPLLGFVEEMNLIAVRDAITPIDGSGNIKLRVNLYDQKAKDMEYEVLSLDGNKSIYKGNVKKVTEEITLNLETILEVKEEMVLKITLNLEEKAIRYYTRVVAGEGFYIKECMDFAENFHKLTFDKAQEDTIKPMIESSSEVDNTTFQHITIQSDITHITWGKLKPEVISEIDWSIKESNEMYTSFLLEYQVRCVGDKGELETYSVKEFLRVRISKGKSYLLDYNRDLNRRFGEEEPSITKKGINLGIVSPEVEYKANANGTSISFVQERELWNYNKESDELSLVFSFSKAENVDIRTQYDKHDVKIINVDKKGNTTFLVYGYMNRGNHEGKVGIAVYYFDSGKNIVEEKAFIVSSQSFGVLKETAVKSIYYNQKNEAIYAMIGGTLYKVDLQVKDGVPEKLVESLVEGQYVTSEDGRKFAYQIGGDINSATEIKILDLSSDSEQVVTVEEGECIKPIGFILGDIVYGIGKRSDVGKAVTLEEITPMYALEIRGSKNEVVKTYQVDQIYILDAFIEKNMITLNRVTKEGEFYTPISEDYITSNEEIETENIYLETYETKLKETQVRIMYKNGIKDTSPQLLQPQHVLYESPRIIAFGQPEEKDIYYVYGLGELIGVYNKVKFGIEKAEEVSGVVVASNQAYIWEKGNRALAYEIEEITTFQGGEEATLTACAKKILAYEGKEVDVNQKMVDGESPIKVLSDSLDGVVLNLADCTIEQVLYLISNGTPVIAMTGPENAVLLVGYSQTNVLYLDPATGASTIVSIEEMQEMIKQSGNTLIGYVR